MALHGAGRLAQWVSPRQLCGEGFEWMISLSLKVLVWAGLSQEGMLAARAHQVLGDSSSALPSLCEEADLGGRVLLTPAS